MSWVVPPRFGLNRLVLAIPLTLLLAGCAGSQDAAAGSAAQDLLDAVRDGDGAAACAALAAPTREELEQTSGKACPAAVLEEDLSEGTGDVRVQVFDSMAQVQVGAETLFLSRFDGTWLVVAAACTDVPTEPYDCSIGLP
jgi:hypothetical protein